MPAMAQNYEKISPTAVLVAYIRAQYTDMPFTKEIYQAVRKFSKPSLLERTPSFVTRFAFFFPRSSEQVAGLEGRYLATNEALGNLGKDFAIVEIASGLSPRGLDWFGRNSLYVETDLPGMLGIKERVVHDVLQKMEIEQNPNHHFYPLNALEREDWNRLGQSYFSEGPLNIAVVSEGLFNYLSRGEQEKMRDNIKKFFESYASTGVWITPDFSMREDVMRGSRILNYSRKRIEQDTKRSYCYFGNEEEVLEFLMQGGFKANFQDSVLPLKKLTCISKLRLNEDKVKEVLDRYRVCLAISEPTK